jgi:FkbM family methyltransferase
MIDRLKVLVRHLLEPYPAVFCWVAWGFHALGFGTKTERDYLFDLARRRGRDVFFLQIGANDGVRWDPIHYFVSRYGWSGILMEPVRRLYDSLVANYRNERGLIFENVALAETDEPRTFYRVNMTNDLPDFCDGLGSFNRDIILSHRSLVPDIEKHIVEEVVECLSFRSLTAKHRTKRIDLVMIDVEGYELAILRQIDLVQFRPELIIYEHAHLAEDDQKAAEQLLSSHGYNVYQVLGTNSVAIPKRD